MTLRCSCGSYDIRITAQSYGDQSAFEGYECGTCGRTGSLTHTEYGSTTLDGCLESDGP
jgi:hypothetical protein